MFRNFQTQAKIAAARARFFEQASSVESETQPVAPDTYYLTLPGQLTLAATGADVPVDPHYIALWRRTIDTDFNCPRDFEERYAFQQPLRQTWLENLKEPKPVTSAKTGSWQERILHLIASERVMTRALLAQKLRTSLATISRELAPLLADHLIDEETQSEHTGRPQQILRLSVSGLEKVRAEGVEAVQAPASDSKALGERLFHQSIELAILKTCPEAGISRAYASQQGKSLPSPLGTIIPDLIVTNGWDRWLIEAESGKYNYRRLADKLDKYLTSAAKEVFVIAENSGAATRMQIEQWQHERTAKLPEGFPKEVSLRVKYTSFDRLQRHGFVKTIWQEYQLGNPEPDQELDPSVEPLDWLPNILSGWTMTLGSECVFRRKPACIPDAPQVPMPEFVADGIFVQQMLSGGTDANVICLVRGSDWDDDEIDQFLENFSAFVAEYVHQFKIHGVLEAVQFSSSPWLYGFIVLVHEVPGQDRPEDLARTFSKWQLGVQAWETEQHPLRVGVAHASQLTRCFEPYEVLDQVYDLAGYC
jgi:hypothetical protein